MTEALNHLVIGTTEAQVRQLVGEPQRITQEGIWTVWWYGAPTQAGADNVYFRQGTVAIVSQSLDEQPEHLGKYIAQYGTPVKLYRLSDGSHDSLRLIVYTWPQQGKAILVSGYDASGQVVRMESFKPEANEVFEASGSAGSRYTQFTRTTADPRVFSDALSVYRITQASPVIALVLLAGVVAIVVAVVRRILHKR